MASHLPANPQLCVGRLFEGQLGEGRQPVGQLAAGPRSSDRPKKIVFFILSEHILVVKIDICVRVKHSVISFKTYV